MVSRLALGLICFPGRSNRLEGVVVSSSDVVSRLAWDRSIFGIGRPTGRRVPVEVGLLLELQGSGRLYWQISFFRGSAGFSFVSIQFAL